MAYKLPAKEELDHQWRQMELRFQEFHRRRDLDGPWNAIHNRELPVGVQPELKEIGEGIEYRSPALHDATAKHKATMQMNPTVIDVRVAGLSQKARDTERSLALHFRRSWDLQNPRRIVDARRAEGQVRQGLLIDRKCYKPFAPPEDGEDLKMPFYWESCLIDGFYWPGGVIDPEGAIWYRYSVPYVESGLKKNGERVKLDAYGNVGWMGAHESYEKDDYASEKKITVIVRDYPSLDDECCPLEGCDHPQRYVTTYVCAEGQKMDEAEHVETVASPFKTSIFYAIGGVVMHTERDPDKVYQPLHLPLYELMQWRNYLVTVTAILARAEAKDDSYLNYGGTSAETLAVTRGSEGGAKDTVEKPEAGANEMPAYPGQVERFPKVTSQHLITLIQMVDKEIENYMPNRYLSGDAYTEASNATGTAYTLAMQAAGLTYEPLLAEQDGAIERSIRDEAHAYCYWSHFCPDGVKPKWAVILTGDEAVARGRGRAGESVSVGEAECSTDFDLVITTGNLTWAEKQAKWTLAKDKYLTKVFTKEDLIREAGIMDVEMQKELLFADDVGTSLDPLIQRMAQLLLTRQAAIKTGHDFGQLLGQQPAVAPAVPGGPPAPPSQPQQPAQTSAPQQPNPYPAAAAHSLQPTVNLPPIAGPNGGSSGTQ